MNLLAFDTSTETLSVAVRAGAGGAPLVVEGPGGARASAELIPAIEHLLDRAGLRLDRLDAIAFGRGPGSFTGLRTACAVAQGLGFGSGVPVLALDTLLALAEDAHGRSGATRIVAVLDARMDEVYAAAYERDGTGWRTEVAPFLGAPEQVVLPAGWTLAGQGLENFDGRLPAGPRVAATPSALALLRLAPAALAVLPAGAGLPALPLYLRDKVAQTTQERAVARARKELPAGAGGAGEPA